MTQSVREMPVRADTWRPTDPVMETILRRCIADAEAGAARDGVREYMAGALILATINSGRTASGRGQKPDHLASAVAG